MTATFRTRPARTVWLADDNSDVSIRDGPALARPDPRPSTGFRLPIRSGDQHTPVFTVPMSPQTNKLMKTSFPPKPKDQNSHPHSLYADAVATTAARSLGRDNRAIVVASAPNRGDRDA